VQIVQTEFEENCVVDTAQKKKHAGSMGDLWGRDNLEDIGVEGR